MTRLGFIGTGNITAFLVAGLHRAGAGYDIMVSPRNAARAEDLRRRFGVTIAGNQDIADACDLVVVGLLPQDAPSVLAGLAFRPGQTVLSVMAGIGLATVTGLVAPATAAVAMMPGLANAWNVGPSVLHPDNPAAHALLSRLGPVHVYDDGGAYLAASVMGAFSGMTLLMMRDAIGWFAANGLDPADARRLVAEVLQGNATVLLQSPLGMDDVARGVVTPGGITAHGRKVLDGGGSWPKALDSVLQRISTRN